LETPVQKVCLEHLHDLIGFDHSQCEQEHYIPSYRMTLQDVADGRPAGQAADLTGWLALLQSHNQSIQVAVGLEADGQGMQVGCVSVADAADREHPGGRPAVCMERLRQAQGLPEMDFCELNFLEIPGLLFQGFWLKSNDSSRSCCISPVFFLQDCVENRVYTMPEFMAAMQGFARERMSQPDNSPRG